MIINGLVNKKMCRLGQAGSMRNMKLSRIPILKYLAGVSTGACNRRLQALKELIEELGMCNDPRANYIWGLCML